MTKKTYDVCDDCFKVLQNSDLKFDVHPATGLLTSYCWEGECDLCRQYKKGNFTEVAEK